MKSVNGHEQRKTNSLRIDCKFVCEYTLGRQFHDCVFCVYHCCWFLFNTFASDGQAFTLLVPLEISFRLVKCSKTLWNLLFVFFFSFSFYYFSYVKCNVAFGSFWPLTWHESLHFHVGCWIGRNFVECWLVE